MLPKTILHNPVSLDGSLTRFEPNMGLHYQIAGKYNADAHLICSNTKWLVSNCMEEAFLWRKRKILKNPKEVKVFLIGLYLTLKPF